MDYNTLDHYRVISSLGHGGFSKVKLVCDETGIQFAAKIFKEMRPEMQDRLHDCLVNETENMKKLHHPNIVSLVTYKKNGVYTKKDRSRKSVIYIIMELCSRGSLFDYIFSNGFMEESLARHYFRQLVSAIEACHNAGICHRDIKPENILFDARQNIKLSDFGFSYSLEGRNGTGFLASDVGTQGYIAPEINIHRAYRGEEVDVFSLGVVLFIMRSLNPPFIRASNTDPYYSMLLNREAKFWEFSEKNKSPNHFSAPFRTLIQGMLAYNPSDRYTIATIKNSE